MEKIKAAGPSLEGRFVLRMYLLKAANILEMPADLEDCGDHGVAYLDLAKAWGIC